MDKVIIIVVILGIAMLAGSGVANSVSLDLSAGPHAEGQQAIQLAQATQTVLESEADKAAADQKLADQTLLDDKTRADRIRTAKIFQWVLGIAGGFSLALALVFAAINISASMSIINFRLAVAPIPKRSGSQVGWVLPLVPNMLYVTSDDAPGLVTMLDGINAPRLSEPESVVGLALASTLKEQGRFSRPNPTEVHGSTMATLSSMLNGIPRQLTASRQEEQ